ncbi:MAG TPA: hypothetical protein VGG06_13235 [Thermoanaerobaculia bacterium]|jgi:hypothetical protein
MSENETATAQTEAEAETETDGMIEEIHEIQEEIFDLDDEIDDLLDSAGSPEELVDLVEAGYGERKRRHLERLHADWRQLLANSRDRRAGDDFDFELSAAMVHFVGDLLMSQPAGTDQRWIRQLRQYIEEKTTVVN